MNNKLTDFEDKKNIQIPENSENSIQITTGKINQKLTENITLDVEKTEDEDYILGLA